MKGKFDAYVLWPLVKKFQNWIVDLSTARDFTVCMDMDKQKAKCASSMRSNLFVKEIFLQSTIKTVTELHCITQYYA